MEAEQVTCLILSHGLTYVSPPISGRHTKVAKDQKEHGAQYDMRSGDAYLYLVPRSCFPCFIVGETLAATSGPLLECKEYGPSDLVPIRQSHANLLKRGPKPHLEDKMKMKGLLRGCCHQKKRCMDIVLAVFYKSIIQYWYLSKFVFTRSMLRWGARSRKDLQVLWPVVLASNSCWIITYCTLFAWGC